MNKCSMLSCGAIHEISSGLLVAFVFGFPFDVFCAKPDPNAFFHVLGQEGQGRRIFRERES